MSVRRRRWPWIVFAGCTALMLAALGGMTALTVSMARSDAELRAFADRQEPIRLALWRLDSWAAPIIARENARPAASYEPYFTQDAAYTREFEAILPGEVLTPSPLLTFASPWIDLHFQIHADGRVTSPQAPRGNTRDLAEVTCSTIEFSDNDDRLARVAALIEHNALDDRIAAARKTQALLADADPSGGQRGDLKAAQQQQIEWSTQEYQQRQQNVAELNRPRLNSRAGTPAPQTFDMKSVQNDATAIVLTPVIETLGPLAPVWCDPVDGGTPALVFVREVEAGGVRSLQGFVVDWAAMSARLRSEIDDLLPDARLEPVRIDAPGPIAQLDATRVMATMPVMLIPGEPAAIATTAGPGWSVAGPLIVMWAVVLAAMLVSGLTLRAVMALGRRRAQFASAVTHELRTPLTSFQLYTEMLADGMVTDDAQRQSYLDALRRQAGRLSSIVENILAFSRVEDGRAGMQRERMTVAALLERTRGPLEERAGEAGAPLTIDVTDDAAPAELDVDADAVGRILFNLVDNACKYGGGEAVSVRITTTGRDVSVEVCDAGPGVPAEARLDIFTPFQRGPAASDGAIPGAGVGLALSRALARDLGGDLTCRESSAGGCFVLRLPASGST